MKQAVFSVMLCAAMGQIGCGTAEDTGTGTVSMKLMITNSGAVNFNHQSRSNLRASSASRTASYDDLDIATSATGDGLQSFRMYFRSIQICQSLVSTGSGYSNPSGCVDILNDATDDYTGTEAPTAADRTRFTAATAKFVDVLSAAGRASLTKSVAVAAGEYNYGIIEAHPWAYVKAKSGTACTKAAGAAEYSATGGDGIVTYHTGVTSLSCAGGEAEEVLTYLANANTNFKFTTPFTVADGDEIDLGLAFDLSGEVKLTLNSGGGGFTDGTHSFSVPMLKIVPVPRKSGDTTKVETYTLGNASTHKEVIRFQVYYNESDEEKSVLAMNSTVFSTATSTMSKGNSGIYTYRASQEGDVLSALSWDGSEAISLTRHVAGTATLNCTNSLLEECSGLTERSISYDAPTISDLND